MTKLTKEQLEWVYKQNWFPKYCANLVMQGKAERWKSLINEDPDDLISSAFIWFNTPEGCIYWSDVKKEWVKYLEKSSETVLTIDEIAEKFGVDPKNIRIAKE